MSTDFESGCREFESLRARHKINDLAYSHKSYIKNAYHMPTTLRWISVPYPPPNTPNRGACIGDEVDILFIAMQS